uniref:Uncharacterized protein n=1 Tax=Romanomermis culicivorax TaxID=13658 RepID=A0A915KU83_ROMCU
MHTGCSFGMVQYCERLNIAKNSIPAQYCKKLDTAKGQDNCRKRAKIDGCFDAHFAAAAAHRSSSGRALFISLFHRFK